MKIFKRTITPAFLNVLGICQEQSQGNTVSENGTIHIFYSKSLCVYMYLSMYT